MNYAILLISDDMSINPIGNQTFQLTISSDIELNENDKVLGFITKSPQKIIMEFRVTKNSTNSKINLSKELEISQGITIDDDSLLQKINETISLNKNLLLISEDDFKNYKNKLISLIKSDSDKTNVSVVDDMHFEQTIYYGVPGCGKSYCIDSKLEELKITNKELQTIRVVFHPEYTNSDFVGQILPKMINGKIDYEFIPGPFTKILTEAYLHRKTPYALIIEEINRGNAAAIFGELFQLLDRIEDDDIIKLGNYEYTYGWSSYCVNNDYINEEIRKGYKKEGYNKEDAFIPEELFNEFKQNIGIRLPPNLSIFATMNTSDQNVFKLDNAFKRRWNLELISNDFDFTCDNEEEQIKQINQCKALIEGFDEEFFTWGAFRNAINHIITDPDNSEDTSSFADKQLGTWFVKASDGPITSKTFGNKVLEYLWDDVFNDDDKKIFNPDYKTLSQIIDDLKKGKSTEIFKSDFIALVKSEYYQLEEDIKEFRTKTKKEILPQELQMNPYFKRIDDIVNSINNEFNLNFETTGYVGVKRKNDKKGKNFVYYEVKPKKGLINYWFILLNKDNIEEELKSKFGDKVYIEPYSKTKVRCKIELPKDDDNAFAEKKELIADYTKQAYNAYFNKQ